MPPIPVRLERHARCLPRALPPRPSCQAFCPSRAGATRAPRWCLPCWARPGDPDAQLQPALGDPRALDK
jgi:hypothetical protein